MGLVILWLSTSLGTPFLASFYVDLLGRSVNLRCLGESGIVVNYDNSKKPIRFPDSYFISNLADSGFFPFVTIFGPFAIPMSIVYSLTSTVNYTVYASKIKLCKDNKFL